MGYFCYGIDIGTNSARLMLARREQGEIRSAYKMLRTVRTGEGVHESHRLSQAAMARTLVALREFRERIDGEHPELPVFCFATSAVRDAENSAEFVNAVRRETGLEICILTGAEEAEVGFLGAVPSGTGGMIDIGGGSTEFVLGESGKLTFRKSFNAGTIRCGEMFAGEGDAPSAARTMRWAEELFGELRGKQARFTGIGGTITTVSAMLQQLTVYDPQKIQGSRILRRDAEALLQRIADMSIAERKNLPGLQPQRADIIPYGMAVLIAAMRVLELEEITVSDADNLEGYAVRYLG